MALALLAAALLACGQPPAPAAGAASTSAALASPGELPPNAPGRTTLERTLRRDGAGPWFTGIVAAPGEPHLRSWLFPGDASPPGEPGDLDHSLLAFAHLTDLQIVDDRSPMRLEYLDRFANGNDGGPGDCPFGSAYRPQEMLSLQMTDAMARALRNVQAAPATGLGLSFTLLTGDVIDNAQFNETRRYLQVLGGAPSVDWNSEDRFIPEMSVGNFSDRAHYWNPDFPANPSNTYGGRGFPSFDAPGLYEQARQPFAATGLGMPWYVAIGNHDVKVQGNLPIDYGDSRLNPYMNLKQIATADEKVTKIDGIEWQDITDGSTLDQLELFWHLAFGRHAVSVQSDPTRRLLTKEGFIGSHFDGDGLPNGHGFTPGGAVGYYAVPSGPNDLFQFIALDTSPAGKTNGNGLDEAQLTWLFDQLRASSSRYVSGDAWVNQPGVKDKLIVVFAHDTLEALGLGAGEWGDRLLGLLLRFPNVIMLIDGHTHANAIVNRSREWNSPTAGHLRTGFFEINTASPLDWPCQSRIIEVAESGGKLSIFTTMVDADAPIAHDGMLSGPAQLASLGRQVAANDPQEWNTGIDKRAGTPWDRNMQLVMPAPFQLNLPNPVPVADRFGWEGDPAWIAFAAEGGIPPYTWTVSGLPDGLVWSPWQGRYTGTLAKAGTYTVTYGAADARGVKARARTFTWVVAPKLALVPVPPVRFDMEGTWVQGRFTATGGTPPYQWSAVGLPPGITLDPWTGAFAGTLYGTGGVLRSYGVRYTATDAGGVTANGSFTWWVDYVHGTPACTMTFDWGSRDECELSCPHDCGNYGLACAQCDGGVACCN